MAIEINADDLPRFMQCNGSRLMPESYPKGPSAPDSIREEGTAAHYVATAVFTGQSQDPYELVDRKTPNGVYVTVEIAEMVEAFLARLAPNGAMEHDTSWGTVHGRADYVSFDGVTGTVDIPDLKFGYTIVEPEMNWTLISHAISYVDQIERSGSVVNMINLSIFQPRVWHVAGHWRTWTVDRDYLEVLSIQLQEALTAPSDELKTGPLCHRCDAQTKCPAARKSDLKTIDASDMAYTDEMPADELAAYLELLEYAEKRIKSKREALTGLVEYHLQNGRPVGDYHLQATYGHRKWNNGLNPDVIKAISGVEVSSPKFVTPAEAKRRGLSETLINIFTERPSTGTKLIRENTTKRVQRLLK